MKKKVKYVYFSNKLRCRVVYDHTFRHYKLSIQRVFWGIFWIYVDSWWMTVKDGFWGESDFLPVLRMTYLSGNSAEAYKKGTLNIDSRAMEFMKEYIDDINNRNEAMSRLL